MSRCKSCVSSDPIRESEFSSRASAQICDGVAPTVDDPLRLRGKNYIAKHFSPRDAVRCKQLPLRDFRFWPHRCSTPYQKIVPWPNVRWRTKIENEPISEVGSTGFSPR